MGSDGYGWTCICAGGLSCLQLSCWILHLQLLLLRAHIMLGRSRSLLLLLLLLLLI